MDGLAAKLEEESARVFSFMLKNTGADMREIRELLLDLETGTYTQFLENEVVRDLDRLLRSLKDELEESEKKNTELMEKTEELKKENKELKEKIEEIKANKTQQLEDKMKEIQKEADKIKERTVQEMKQALDEYANE